MMPRFNGAFYISAPLLWAFLTISLGVLPAQALLSPVSKNKVMAKNHFAIISGSLTSSYCDLSMLKTMTTKTERLRTLGTALFDSSPKLQVQESEEESSGVNLQQKSSPLKSDEYGEFIEGKICISRRRLQEEKNGSYSIYYRIYYPNSKLTPVVVCHGGPSLPSPYLYPTAPLLCGGGKGDHQRRPIIFYDQLGCGKSDQPKDLSCYSIPLSVLDLKEVISQLVGSIPIPKNNKAKKFHLFGHSYGGVLAYEYYKAVLLNSEGGDNKNNVYRLISLESLILSNAPTDLGIANMEYERLYIKNPLLFWKNHLCSTAFSMEFMPKPFKDSMSQIGKVWSGMDAVADYNVAAAATDTTVDGNNDREILSLSSLRAPAVFIISASNDFAYKVSNKEVWEKYLSSSSFISGINLEACAHYPFYEDSYKFASIIQDFFSETEDV